MPSKPVWGRKLPGGFDSRPPPRGENGEKRWSRDDSGSLSPISLLCVPSDVRSDTDRFDHAIEWHLGTPAERFHFHLARGLEQEQREPIGR
jgi:hypothetical protein